MSEVLDAIDRGDEAATLDALRRLTSEAGRRLVGELRSRGETWHTVARRLDGTTAGWAAGTDAQRACVQLGAWAVFTLDEATTARWLHQAALTRLVRELPDRTPPSLNSDALARRLEAGEVNWLAVDILVLAGRAPPTTDAAVSALVEWLPYPTTGLVDEVRARPTLLASGILYRLFEVEGGTQTSLAAADKYRYERNTWSEALTDLARGGELDRDRLLDASLEALARDFPTFRSGWYSRFHDRLDPDRDEEDRRADRYVALLGSQVPATVSWALARVDALHRRGRVTDEAVLESLPTLLLQRQAGVVARATKLAARLVRSAPGAARRVGEALVDALIHEDPAVQERLLDALGALRPSLTAEEATALDGRAAGWVDAVAPSLRSRLGGTRPASASPTTRARVAADPLDPGLALAPIASLDEALLVVAHALEAPADAEAFERALGAMSAHPRGGPGWRELTSPIRKRMTALARRGQAGPDLEVLLAAWLDGELLGPDEPAERETPLRRFSYERCRERATWLAAAVALPALATPSHPGGWVSFDAFAERLAAWEAAGRAPGRNDAVLALCRLPPDRVAEAAIRLGGDPAFLRVGSSLRLAFTVTLTTREGWESNSWTAIGVGPADPAIRPQDALDLPAILASDLDAVEPWRWTSRPTDLSSAFAAEIRQLQYGLDYTTPSADVLRHALLPWVELGETGHWLLTFQLLSGLPGVVRLAQDVAHACIAEGRADVALLGEILARLAPTTLFKGKRLARALAPVAAASPSHGAFVAAWLTAGLRGDPTQPPTDVAAVLSLLREVGLACGVPLTDPQARAWLEGLTVGGKTAALARQLLAGT